MGRLTGHIGNMDCDVFMTKSGAYILEMNARFGGGYPFSHEGGCNLPLALINWIKEKDVSPDMLVSQTGIIEFKELYVTKK